jgi:phage baseplate assembly protein W
MARNTRTFTDLDLNFTRHPITDDVSVKFDEQAIKQSVKNLVLTNHYERPFHPEIGSEVKALLFEPANPMTSIMLKQAIVNTINNYEPRVRLIDVIVRGSIDNNTIYVSIEFTIINTTSPITVDLVLERTR